MSAAGIGRIKLEKHPAGSARRSSVLQLMVCMGYYLNLKRKGASKNGLLINLQFLEDRFVSFNYLEHRFASCLLSWRCCEADYYYSVVELKD